jgi:phosphatidate cytidylyltransferase
MAIVWIADIAAYLVGYRFGRRKLAPRISPGKTWEGAAAALAATAVYACAWIIFAPGATPAVVRDLPWSPAWMLLLVAGLTALSVIGDLLESAMKRQAGLKDSGALLPGHGGVLDRIDALTPVLPVAALVSLV